MNSWGWYATYCLGTTIRRLGEPLLTCGYFYIRMAEPAERGFALDTQDGQGELRRRERICFDDAQAGCGGPNADDPRG